MLKTFFLALTLGTAVAVSAQAPSTSPPMDQSFTLVIHGGAGTILKKNMTPELEQQYRAKLEEALKAGYDILAKGGTSIDAVEAAIMVMENSPLFNAGKGAVFTSAGTNEMDASIMDGKTRNAGAVAGVTSVKNPIKAARLVMEKSPHVMLAGEGADEYAKQNGLETVDPSYFRSETRWKQWQKIKDTEKQQLDHDDRSGDTGPDGSEVEFNVNLDKKYGTVGAAAVDHHGNLAAATSTGGMTNKRYGRVGDSPIIAAGTYADNNTCAVSSTGHGEFFIRAVVAYDIAALMQYKGLTLEEAAQEVINNKLKEMGGKGGIIATDAEGNVSMVFNTPGMYRGYIKADGQPVIGIYQVGDEH